MTINLHMEKEQIAQAQLANGQMRRCLHTFFLESAARYPEAPALALGEREWTYGELEEAARRWAHALLTAGRGRVERVGVFAYRSYVSYVGTLASLFAGATYVPLNRTFPLQRTQAMIDMANLDAIIVDANSLQQLRALLPHLPSHLLLLLPENEASFELAAPTHVFDRHALERVEPLGELSVVPGHAIAYLLFTSGSTGMPKGVPITHNNVESFLTWNLKKYQFTPEDRFTQTFDQTFDLSIFDLFMAWGSGACLCVPQPIHLLAPFQFVQDQRITVWFSVPSLISLLIKKQFLKPGSLSSLRWSLFCGEALPQAAAEAWQKAAPNSIIENLYGPTELTIACASYRWDALHSPAHCANGLVPLGQIYERLAHIVVDENQKRVVPGEAGELCVAGEQTFPGYWNDSHKTSERFFSLDGDPRPYYRTGDLVRWQDGRYIYLGRTDHQVKIQGYRIELGEIESLLRQNGNVVDAAAIGWPCENGKAQGIVAFVSGTDLDAKTLLQGIKARVPTYMLPREIHILEAMPYNVNGKIDRTALQRLLKKEVSHASISA